MSRYVPLSIHRLGVCLCLGFSSSLVAAEPLKEPAPLPAAKAAAESKPTAPKEKTSATAGRRKLEAQLRQPANLDFGDRKSVSVAEFLAEIRKVHQLSIRFDAPGLAGLYGPEAFVSLPAEEAPATPPSTNKKPAASEKESPVAKSQMITKPQPTVAPVAPSKPPVATKASPATVGDAYGSPVGETLKPSASNVTPQPFPLPPLSADGRSALVTPIPPSVVTVTYSEENPINVPLAPPAAATTVAAPAAPAAPPEEPWEPTQEPKEVQQEGNAFDHLLQMQISLVSFNPQTVTLGTALRQALDSLSVVNPLSESDDELMLPAMFTEATKFDYMVEEDGLLISFRFMTLLQKETRVYSLKNLPGVTSDQLAAIIRQSVRPWSWRSHINDLGEQLKNGTDRLPKSMAGSLAKAGTSALEVVTEGAVSLASATSTTGEVKPEATKELTAEEMKQLGHGVVNTLTTMTHASLSALEMVHYAELPTATMQTLPGRLVITQTQAAHREIAELLEQLAEEQ